MHTECTRKYMYDIEKNTKFVIACNNQYKCKIMKDIVIIITLSLFLCAKSCAQDIKDNPQFAKSVKSNIRKAKRSSGISRPFCIIYVNAGNTHNEQQLAAQPKHADEHKH